MISVSSAAAPVEVVNVEGYPEIEFTNFVGHYAKTTADRRAILSPMSRAAGRSRRTFMAGPVAGS